MAYLKIHALELNMTDNLIQVIISDIFLDIMQNRSPEPIFINRF